MQFQSQRRFFGGSNLKSWLQSHHPARFNRRGDSLGGATFDRNKPAYHADVSIAEAILWGEQRSPPGEHCWAGSFNRRGDSLGGATVAGVGARAARGSVSIAEAILWGEQPHKRVSGLGKQMFQSQRRFFGGSNRPHHPGEPPIMIGFNRRGDSLGGATLLMLLLSTQATLFQSQRRFFGGSNITS